MHESGVVWSDGQEGVPSPCAVPDAPTLLFVALRTSKARLGVSFLSFSSTSVSDCDSCSVLKHHGLIWLGRRQIRVNLWHAAYQPWIR